jgi:imidazolonepropionase-like amidohydrolase
MKSLVSLLTLLVLVTGRAEKPAEGVKTLHRVAFVHVNVIDVDEGRLLPDSTVYIEDGVIQSIREANDARLPKNTFRIDGKNKFLIPGLADMHIHHTAQGAFVSGSPPAMYDEKDLMIYLVNGITTVRNMAGSPQDLVIKKRLSTGQLLGPHYYSSGPPLVTTRAGLIVDSPQRVSEVIVQQRQAGYDFIKVYCCFSKANKELYDRLIETAKANNIPAVGHIQFHLPIDDALKLRSIEHLEHLPRYFKNALPDIEKHGDLVKKLLESKTVICPTLTPSEVYKLFDDKALAEHLAKPEMSYFSVPMFDKEMALLKEEKSYLNDKDQGESIKELYELAMRYVYFLHQQKIPLILGSDSGGLFPVAPGFSIHRELELLNQAGLSPLEALQTGTINVARFLGNQDKRGSVGERKEADLVLLDQNPLINISNTRAISGVMIGKKWIDKKSIEKILLSLKKR